MTALLHLAALRPAREDGALTAFLLHPALLHPALLRPAREGGAR